MNNDLAITRVYSNPIRGTRAPYAVACLLPTDLRVGDIVLDEGPFFARSIERVMTRENGFVVYSGRGWGVSTSPARRVTVMCGA